MLHMSYTLCSVFFSQIINKVTRYHYTKHEGSINISHNILNLSDTEKYMEVTFRGPTSLMVKV